MNKKTTFILAAFNFFLTMVSFAQNAKTVTEYLNVPGPIVINQETYNLAWTSHPSPVYYKQEYIRAADQVEKFKKMVMVEVLVGDAKAADLAKAKIAELKQLKERNPIVNYEVFQKNGEIMLDFLQSDSPDGRNVQIIERNVYRYKDVTDKNGKKCVALFAMSERAYGKDVDTFLAALKKNKSVAANAVAAYTIPELAIKK